MLQVERQQQSLAANLAEAMTRGHPLQLAFQIESGINDRSEKIRRTNRLQNRESGRAHQRIAVEGATLVAMFETGSRLSGQQRRQRHAAADALAEGHDIRLDLRMFVVKKFYGAAHAGLDLIDDEQQATLSGK